MMVGEFPELQGHVGRLLAAHQGEDAGVALAIEEHYLPRNAEDALPTTPEGRALALADRTWIRSAGCFLLDQKPKGGGDPLGLRRAANGVVQILLASGARVSLYALFNAALRVWDPEGKHPSVQAREELVEFTLTRLRAQLQELGATEYVDAVLATGDKDVVALWRRLEALLALSRSDGFGALKTTFKRHRLTRDGRAAPGPRQPRSPGRARPARRWSWQGRAEASEGDGLRRGPGGAVHAEGAGG
ncbi:MAG: glycine--tRNA ligase subunit beta [Planctomycetes bacterium]|nr:glycine--tRNA ligase subunit beta [Planctomycetota bacterium]